MASFTAVPATTNGVTTPPHMNGIVEKKSPEPAESKDDNPYTQIIESLRAQNNELFAQASEAEAFCTVTQLNSKLVQSYDRVSDLEDQDHVAQAALRNANLRVAQLEMERMEHLSALDTGLLVEKAHVTTELSRLMERVSEESAQRGEAESAKLAIEKDLDDLSATLFNQANTMVAEARFARAQSEKKAAACETSMKSAEEAVTMMQVQMQELIAAREKAERDVTELRSAVGSHQRTRTTSLLSAGSNYTMVPRLMNNNLPFEEFLLFVAHLRTLRPGSQQPPAVHSLVSLPFIARLITEDSDPTLRLDLAPSLNWLTRRSISTAVQSGQLQIEPIHSGQIFVEFTTHSQTSTTTPTEILCALCGKNALHNDAPTPTLARPSLQNTAVSGWGSASRFFRNSLGGSAPTSKASTPQHVPSSPSTPSHLVYIFRPILPSTTTSLATGGQTRSQPYALCMSGWCLARLRAVCELWRFVRTGVIEKVWEEEISTLPTTTSSGSITAGLKALAKAPPMIPARSASRVGSLWEKGLGALSGSGSGTTTPTQQSPAPADKNKDNDKDATPLPPPPQRHIPRRLPPPPASGHSPPPLPARSESRRNLASPPKSPEKLAAELPSEEGKKTVDLGDGETEGNINSPKTKEASLPDTQVQSTQVEALNTPTPSRPASPIKRPSTPLSTALPPSAPSTPQRNSVALPSTPGSAAPPPLPRRAAARRTPITARTGSPRTSLLMEGKRNSIDGVLMGSPVRKSLELVEERPGTPNGRPGSPRPEQDGFEHPKPEPATITDEPKEVVEETKPEAEPDVKEDEVATEKEAPASEPVQQKAPESPVSDNSHPIPPPLPRRRPVPPPPPPVEIHTEEKPEEEETEDDKGTIVEDESALVSDRTWEERAWRELARLRADMFWARLGSVPNGQIGS